MKPIHFAALLSTCTLAVTSCDNKKETATAPAPATTTTTPAEVKFSDPAANSFLDEYKGFAKDITEALKTGDKTKLQPLMGKAAELAAKGKEWMGKLKPEELETYKAMLTQYAKPVEEAAKKMAGDVMGKMGAMKDKVDALKGKLGGLGAPDAPAPDAPAPDAPTLGPAPLPDAPPAAPGDSN